MRKETLIYLGLSLALLAVTVGGYVFWFSLLTKAQGEAASASASIVSIETENAQIAAAKGALATLTNDEAAVRAYFLSPEDIVGFLEALQSSGKSFGTTIDVVSVSPNKDGRIGISLSITGSFEAVMRTVGALEFGPHDIRVSSLTINTVSHDAGSPWSAAAMFTVGALASSTTP